MSGVNHPTSKKRSRKPKAEPLSTRVIGSCKATEGADVAEAANAARLAERQALVDKFLRWPLPQSVCSDLCVTDREYKFPRYGTNLLDVNETRQMLDYLLEPV